MKLLLIGSYHLAEGFKGFTDALERKGYEIEFIGLSAVFNELSYVEDFNEKVAAVNLKVMNIVNNINPDIILLWKGEYLTSETLHSWKKKGIKIVFYSWDDPFYITQEEYSKNIRKQVSYIDYVFTCCEGVIPLYKSLGFKNVSLMWPGFDPSVHHPISEVSDRYKSDISFVATNTYDPRFSPMTKFPRIDMVKKLLDFDIKLWGQGEDAYGWLGQYGDPGLKPYYQGYIPFNESRYVFSGSKINLSSHVMWGNKYFNERTFQILGCQGLLFMDRVPGAETVFQENKHVVFYDSLENLYNKCKYYLGNPEEGKEIANSGYEEVLKNHTWDHRVEIFCNRIT